MIRGGFLSVAAAFGCAALACAGMCFGQGRVIGYAQPFLGQGVYDLTSVYSQDYAALAEERRAYSELSLTAMRLRREFADNPEYKAALQEVEDAHAALEAARRPVLEAVARDPHHAELEQKHSNVSSELTAAPLPLRDLLDLAARKMEYGTAMHLMEAEALQNDPVAVSARQRMIDAQRKADDMREKFESTIYLNQRWAAAKQSWDNAEISLAAADGAVVGANVTACLAIAADQRHQLYNFSYGNFYLNPPFVDVSNYYGRRY